MRHPLALVLPIAVLPLAVLLGACSSDSTGSGSATSAAASNATNPSASDATNPAATGAATTDSSAPEPVADTSAGATDTVPPADTATPTASADSAAAIVTGLEATDSMCGAYQLIYTGAFITGMAPEGEDTDGMWGLLAPALEVLATDASTSPPADAPAAAATVMDAVARGFGGLVDEMRANGMTDEMYQALLGISPEGLAEGARAPDNPALQAIIDTVEFDLDATLDATLDASTVDAEGMAALEPYLAAHCPELAEFSGG